MFKLVGISGACLATGVAVLISTGAHAVPITYDFTGQGSVCAAGCFTGDFFGTITIDVIAPGPSGDDIIVYEDIGYASDPSGWVNSSYVINWAEGTFAPSAFPGAVTANQSAIVVNGPNDDWLLTGAFYQNDDPSFQRSEGATFMRYTQDTSWLNDLSFRTDLGLATGPGSFNELNFNSYFYNWSTQESSQSRGVVQVQSLVERAPISVPEPATLYLLALGLMGLWFRRVRAV